MSKSFNRLLACGGMAVGLSLLPAQARMVAVYGPPGQAIEPLDLRVVAAAVLNGQPPSNAPYAIRVSETSKLTKDYSVAPGVTAFFLSDQNFDMDPDFATDGQSMSFETLSGSALAKQGTAGVEKVFPTALLGASYGSGSLQLHYSAAKSGKSSLEAYGVNGHSFGKWTWNDAAPGEYRKSFETRGMPQGVFFLKWKNGSVESIQRIFVEGMKAKP